MSLLNLYRKYINLKIKTKNKEDYLKIVEETKLWIYPHTKELPDEALEILNKTFKRQFKQTPTRL